MSQATPVASASDEPIHPRPPTPAPPPRKPRGSDLPARLATAAVLVPTVIYLVVLGGLPYLATVVLIVVQAQREFYRLIEEKGAHPLVPYGLLAGAALPVVAWLGNEYQATLIMTATLLTVMVRQVGKAQIAEALVSISGTFFGVFYVGWLLSHAVVLRNFHHAALGHLGADGVAELGIVPEAGIFFVLFCLVAVVLCDAGAYFSGRAYGRRKLAPRISPGKSVEGAIGGLLTGTLGALGCKAAFDFFWPDLSRSLDWLPAVVIAFAVSVAAIVGDLVESLLKRDARTKDTGHMLPGMGGVMDRIDSPLLGIPVMYYLLLLNAWLRTGPAAGMTP